MRRSRLIATAAVVGVAGFTGAALAGGNGRDFATDLSGFEEVSSISTTGGGSVEAAVNRAGTEIRYTLRYDHLEGTVQQSHIHFAQEGVNGPIVVFLCTNLNNGRAGVTPTCPTELPGEVTGVLTEDDVSTTPASANAITQGIEAKAFAELVRAMRAGVTYANVHSTKWPAGEIRGQFDHEQGHED